jgi:PAS domain S-box-containing protein
LNIFDESTNTFKRLNESEGLPNSFIYSILQDNNGMIWITTNKGAASLHPETLKVTSYDLYDGLQDYEFNTNAAYKSKGGEIYIGGPSGMNRFNPSLLLSSNVNPSIVITTLKLNDADYVSEVDLNQIEELNLDYSQNNIYFEFAALDYSFPQRNRYRYKMEGFDENWIESGSGRMAKYTNLDPGKYVFIIQGTNSDGRWSDFEKRIVIVITPPFYQTVWFYILVFFAVSGLVYLFYKYRVMSLKKTNKMLEDKVTNRTLAIEEEKKKLELLNEQLEKLSIVASKTDNAVIIADENGVIEWINEGFGRMHSFLNNHEEYYGKTIGETSSNSNFQKYLDSAVKNRKSFSYESENVNFEGKRYAVQSTLTPIFDDSGALRKIVIIDTDITERKKNEEIIREKNKDITDSINYAVRIQQAIFPDDSKMKEILRDSFVLFKPKDIVSGDFYFIEPILSNEHHELAGFAVGDCTGHGVPGAFMSIIANNYLKQSLHRKDINSPAQALDFVSENIYLTLSAKSGNQIIRDGMDVAFCVIDYKTNILTYSGANRPLILISDGKMTEIKGDPQAVGYQEVVKPFTLHKMNVKKDDIIYLFSDGYSDQFGGPEGKKFKYSRFKELLLRIHTLSLPEQKKILNEEFESWRSGSKTGNLDKELEQLDDVCVMGVKIH